MMMVDQSIKGKPVKRGCCEWCWRRRREGDDEKWTGAMPTNKQNDLPFNKYKLITVLIDNASALVLLKVYLRHPMMFHNSMKLNGRLLYHIQHIIMQMLIDDTVLATMHNAIILSDKQVMWWRICCRLLYHELDLQRCIWLAESSAQSRRDRFQTTELKLQRC